MYYTVEQYGQDEIAYFFPTIVHLSWNFWSEENTNKLCKSFKIFCNFV